MDDAEAWVRRQLQQASREQVYSTLRQQGYTPAAARSLLASVRSSHIDRVYRASCIAWAAAGGILLIGYILHGAGLVPLFGLDADAGLRTPFLPAVGTGIAALALIGIGAGVYAWRNGYPGTSRRLIAPSAVGGTVVILGIFIRSSVLGPVSMTAVQDGTLFRLTMASLYVHAAIAAVLGVSTYLWWHRYRRYAVLPVAVFAAIALTTFGIQYTTVTQAAGDVPAAPETAPAAEYTTLIGDRMSQTALVPPPFGRYAVAAVGAAQVDALAPLLRQADRRADTVLTGAGTVCVTADTASFEMQAGADTEQQVAVRWTAMADRMENNRGAVATTLTDMCEDAATRCPSVNASDQVETLVEQQRAALQAYRTITGTDDIPDTFSDPCETRTGSYQAVRLQAVQCTDITPVSPGGSPAVTVDNVGTEPVTGSVALTVYNATGHEWYSEDAVARYDGWESGERTITGSGVSFRDGEQYRVKLVFTDGPVLSAYCIGGNGFCTDCPQG